jgi:hypothetical protein
MAFFSLTMLDSLSQIYGVGGGGVNANLYLYLSTSSKIKEVKASRNGVGC